MVAFILVCLVLLLGLLWGWEIRKRKSLEQEFVKKKNEVCSVKEFSDTILYNVDAYIILVDRNFLVEKTNYYNLNNTSEGQVLRRVGELLRCKNGLDAGACGSHENCKVCPVRNSIEKCFREKGHFSPLETPMRLYMSEKMDNYVDCIVCVSGTYLQLDQDDKVLLTVRDVTRQKKILDELEEARRNAEWAGEQKTAFLANMSHEIRTPLNAIVGFSNLLPSAENVEEEKLYSRIINQNSEILLQLINDILDLSKIEAGTLEYVKQPMNLGEVCRNIYEIHKGRVQEGVTLILDNKEDDLIIEEDRNRIMQVITNFITNATKFTYAGEIRFGFKIENHCIHVYVKDTGIGIEASKVDHIFDRFVKLNSFAQGTGLGLAICRMIIEKIGGEIGVTSETGKGSTFFFTIPYKENSDEHITFSDAFETKYISHTIKRMQKIKKILVAEDVDSNFVLVKNMIGKEYTLLWAKDGFEAVEMYKRYQPDLILMDIKMPRMDGLEATRIIRSYSKEIPVIALTAYAFETDKEQAFEAGCTDFVTKPVSREALEKALGKYSNLTM